MNTTLTEKQAIWTDINTLVQAGIEFQPMRDKAAGSMPKGADSKKWKQELEQAGDMMRNMLASSENLRARAAKIEYKPLEQAAMAAANVANLNQYSHDKFLVPTQQLLLDCAPEVWANV